MTTTLPAPDRTTPDTAGVAERLMAEFEGRVGLGDVSRAVRECWQELRSGGTEPETAVLEQCVREHLAERCA